jgi:hypothetical protein
MVVVKAGKLRWLGYLCRRQEKEPCRILTFHKEKGITGAGNSSIGWVGGFSGRR